MLKVTYILVIILLTGMWIGRLFAQHAISSYEYRWAVFHPFASLKIKHRLPHAMAIYKEVQISKELDTLNSGGKLDAFRHTYTMAFLARCIKAKKLKKLGIAHEKGNYKQFRDNQLEEGERPDSLACEMDLKNNDLGLNLGTANKKTSNEQLKIIILKAIEEGKAWYLKRDAQGNYVNCDNKALNAYQYKERWFMPKCLIRTNE